MATQNRRLYESLNWADEAPQQDEEAPKEPAKPAWGGAKKQESAVPAPVDFKKLQEQEAASKPKENPKPAPQAEPDRYRPPVRSSEGYQNDRYQSRGDGGYQPRYQQGGDGGYQPRTEEYRQREQERNRGEDYRQREREEIPIPDHPPYTARIGNLAWEVTEEALDEYFGELGIVKISLPRDEQQGKIRGFAFIEFNTREGLENALSCNGQGVTIMNREIHVSVSKQRNNDNRSWGPGEGRERDHDRHWGRDRESDRSWGPGEGRERNYGGDRPSDRSWGRSGDRPLERGPTGPPNLGLKPRSDPATLKREPSPPRKKAGSEDPFGAVSVDEEKNKIALEKRLQREKEMEQRAKERLEEAKAKSEQAEKERQARIEEERRKREEERTKMVAEKRKREEEAANKQKPRDTKDNKSWGRSTEYDKSWGPGPGAKKDVYVAPRGTRPPGGNKPPAGRKSDEQAEKPNESAQPTETAQPDETETKQETPSENPYRGGIGRGQAPNKQNQGEGAGRGKKPPKGGAGRGGQGNQGPKKEAPEKDSDGFTVAKDVVKTKQPNVTYKAALGGAPATQEKKASQNPFGVLQND